MEYIISEYQYRLLCGPINEEQIKKSEEPADVRIQRVSRLDDLIYQYLEFKFEPHEIVLVNISNVASRTYWVVNDVVVGEIQKYEDGHIKFWISEQMFNLLRGMFSLQFTEVELHILKYMRKKHNINFYSAGYHAFDNPQEWYDRYPHEKISL